MKRILLVATLLLLGASQASAQSSQFGVRGIGHPGRMESARATAMGGALGVFDGLSNRNPAALAQLGTVTSMFTASTAWTSVTNPAGDGSLTSTRFPQLVVGGPVAHTPVSLAFSYSTYADRDFTIASAGIVAPRGTPVGYTDTLSARGGINDLRLAGSWRVSPRLAVGAGVHLLTGSNRLATRRVFDDTTYIVAEQRAELSYQGFGVSAGFMYQPASGFAIAGSIRQDGSLEIERDSTKLPSSVDLPLTLAAGARLRVTPALDLAAQVTARNWSVADEGIRANGAPGSKNTIEVSGGGELQTDSRRSGHRPIRFGARYATLPFLIGSGQPSEWGVSLGSGMRFRPASDARDVGAIDLTIQRVQRKQGTAYTESAWILSVGVSIFTGSSTP
ncbi:MAG: hypothetical protein ABIR59_12930 [Gemmatimonadales bacterium]